MSIFETIVNNMHMHHTT